jgi:hypothetical protein
MVRCLRCQPGADHGHVQGEGGQPGVDTGGGGEGVSILDLLGVLYQSEIEEDDRNR